MVSSVEPQRLQSTFHARLLDDWYGTDIEATLVNPDGAGRARARTTGALEQEIVENDAEIESLEEDILEYQYQTSTLSNEKETLQSQISNLEEQNTVNDATISDLESQLGEVEATMSEQEDAISDLEEDIDGLSSRLGERSTWKTYHDYGVHFEYPDTIELSPWLATEEAGMLVGVGADTIDGQVDVLVMAWSPTSNDTSSDLDTYLDNATLQFTNDENVNVISSLRMNTTVRGHVMKYQYLLIQSLEDGSYASIILSGWTCEDTGRDIQLTYTTSKADVFADFYRTIESFQCHVETESYY